MVITALVLGTVIALVAVARCVFFGLRGKSPIVRNAVRRFNRSVSNRFQLRASGTPGARAWVIRHMGRKVRSSPLDAGRRGPDGRRVRHRNGLRPQQRLAEERSRERLGDDRACRKEL
jgi:hypothetical protein